MLALRMCGLFLGEHTLILILRNPKQRLQRRLPGPLNWVARSPAHPLLSEFLVGVPLRGYSALFWSHLHVKEGKSLRKLVALREQCGSVNAL